VTRLLVLPLCHRMWILRLELALIDLTRQVCLCVDHPVRKLLGVPKERLFLQVINQLLLLVKMFCTLLEIFLLLKNTKPSGYG